MNVIQQKAQQEVLLQMLEKAQKEQKEGNIQVAEAIYIGVLNDSPHDLNAQFLLASCFQQQGKNGVAICLYEKLLQFLPNVPALHNNLGGCYHQENFDKEAFENYTMAVRLTEEKDAEVLSNLGGMFVNTGTPEKAEFYFKKALELNPEHNQVKWNYSLTLLEQENFAKGFDTYDCGFETKDRKYKDYKLPEWDGNECESIVVCGEQGIGDEIMFSSLLNDLSKKVNKIVYDCHPRLDEMMRRHSVMSEVGLDRFIVHPSRKETDIEWVQDFGCQYRVSIGSLGKFFRRKVSDFPVNKGFLKPDTSRVMHWHKEMAKLGSGLKVGISWFGGNKRTRSDRRSIPLPSWLPILDTPGFVWINSQYNMNEESIDEFYKQYGIKIHSVVSEDDYFDWSMMNLACDFHISVCNSLVHTMGAYGHKVYCMTPFGAAWRYGLKNSKMLWYDSPELIRQTADNDWGNVILQVMNVLKNKSKKVA